MIMAAFELSYGDLVAGEHSHTLGVVLGLTSLRLQCECQAVTLADEFRFTRAVHQPDTAVAVLDAIDAEEVVVLTSTSIATADVPLALISVTAWVGPALPTVCTPSSPLTFP